MRVKKGQIWRDWDCRIRNMRPRLLKVTMVCGDLVSCRNVDTDKLTIIKTRRFIPNSTGYKIWKDV